MQGERSRQIGNLVSIEFDSRLSLAFLWKKMPPKRTSDVSLVSPPKLTTTQRGNKIAALMIDDLAIVCGECLDALRVADKSLPNYVEGQPEDNAVVHAATALAPAALLAITGSFEEVWARQVAAVREIRRQLKAITASPDMIGWRRYLTDVERDRLAVEERTTQPGAFCTHCGEEFAAPEDVCNFKGEQWCSTCIQEY